MSAKWYYYRVRYDGGQKDGWHVCKGHPLDAWEVDGSIIMWWKEIPAEVGERFIASQKEATDIGLVEKECK
jgi:hypothetical protein